MQVIVDDIDDGVVYEFPCGRWFAKDEDDGQISRDLMVNVGPMDAAPGNESLQMSLNELFFLGLEFRTVN